MKSQWSSMPAISTTRRNWISPQWPRALGVRSAVTSLPVSRAQLRLGFDEAADLFVERGIGTGAGFLQFLDLGVHLVERFADRRYQLGDGVLAQLQIAAGSLLSLGEGGAGEFQEGLVVARQGVGGKRLEGIGELLPRVFEERHFFIRALAFCFQARL